MAIGPKIEKFSFHDRKTPKKSFYSIRTYTEKKNFRNTNDTMSLSRFN